MNDLNGNDYWEKNYIFDDVKAGKNEICFSMGIGIFLETIWNVGIR